MSLMADVRALARFAAGLRRFLQWHITPEQARAIVRQRMGERPQSFLRTVEHSVFRNPRSPYLPLLRRAGVTMGDLVRMVLADGVEPALQSLCEAGVYVTFEEFKGRRPIVRDGLEVPVTARDFDNPVAKRSFGARSSGSTGPATRTALDLDHLTDEVPVRTLEAEAFGMTRAPMALWRALPPSPTGLRNALIGCAMGNVPRRWFTPVTSRQVKAPWRARMATEFVMRTADLCGTRLPRPELVPLDRADVLVDWAAETLGEEGCCLIRSFVSMAMRICLAARERGMDLTGTTFMGGGEPPTSAKVRVITEAGAVMAPSYASTELNTIGVACARPADVNDVHVARDLVAVLTRPLQLQGWPLAVDALYVTTLRPHAPKVALNVATDDCGIVERRSCGCPLEEVGYDLHVRHIRSYRKLTGEGVTLVESEAVRVLEEVLPSRFGGSPLDYQLLEEEDERGFTRLSLLVSPRVNLCDEQAVVNVTLRALRDCGRSSAFAAAFWEQAGSLRVRRAEPVWNMGGKFAPLCIAERVQKARG
jgi:hypothetical protein